MALYRAGLRHGDRVVQLLHAPSARYSAARLLLRRRVSGVRLLSGVQQRASRGECAARDADATGRSDGARDSPRVTHRGAKWALGTGTGRRVRNVQPRHGGGLAMAGHRAFSAVAGGDSALDEASGAGVGDGVAGAAAGAPSGAAIDEGVSYPLWFLDPEGTAYQSIMAANDVTATALTAIHDTLGLPWWGTIVAATLLIRVVMLPLNVYAVRNTSRIVDAAVEREQLRKAYQYAVSALGPSSPPMEKFRLLRLYGSGLNAALKKHNCYPWRSFAVPMLQVPLLMATMLGARHLVMLGDETFEAGGALWFSDLTVSDPTYMLPAMALASTYLSLELLFLVPKRKREVVTTASLLRSQGLLPRAKSGIQMLLLGALPFTIHLPSGLFLGWLCASWWSMGYVATIRNPTAYRLITGKHPAGAAPSLDDLELDLSRLDGATAGADAAAGVSGVGDSVEAGAAGAGDDDFADIDAEEEAAAAKADAEEQARAAAELRRAGVQWPLPGADGTGNGSGEGGGSSSSGGAGTPAGGAAASTSSGAHGAVGSGGSTRASAGAGGGGGQVRHSMAVVDAGQGGAAQRANQLRTAFAEAAAAADARAARTAAGGSALGIMPVPIPGQWGDDAEPSGYYDGRGEGRGRGDGTAYDSDEVDALLGAPHVHTVRGYYDAPAPGGDWGDDAEAGGSSGGGTDGDDDDHGNDDDDDSDDELGDHEEVMFTTQRGADDADDDAADHAASGAGGGAAAGPPVSLVPSLQDILAAEAGIAEALTHYGVIHVGDGAVAASKLMSALGRGAALRGGPVDDAGNLLGEGGPRVAGARAQVGAGSRPRPLGLAPGDSAASGSVTSGVEASGGDGEAAEYDGAVDLTPLLRDLARDSGDDHHGTSGETRDGSSSWGHDVDLRHAGSRRAAGSGGGGSRAAKRRAHHMARLVSSGLRVSPVFMAFDPRRDGGLHAGAGAGAGAGDVMVGGSSVTGPVHGLSPGHGGSDVDVLMHDIEAELNGDGRDGDGGDDDNGRGRQ